MSSVHVVCGSILQNICMQSVRVGVGWYAKIAMNSTVLFTRNWGKDAGGMRMGCWIWASVRQYGSWCIMVMGNGNGRMRRMYQVIVMIFGEGLGACWKCGIAWC
jgi:hypothetical protein